MFANLFMGGGVILAIIFFLVWWARSNKKAGRQEADNERAAEYAEDIGEIHDMERIQDEKNKGDFTDLDSAGDFVDGLRDESDDR